MIRRSLLLGAGASALALLAACGGSGSSPSGSGKEIVFSILSTESSQNQETNWKPFLDDMSKQTGLKIKAFYAPNYFALVQAMAAKQIDVGWFSNKSGLDAVERANGEVFVRSSDPSGVDGYFSNIIVPINSKTTLDDILRCDKSLSFSMGDAESTSGTLAPMTYLFGPRNIDPDKCFKTLRSANHDANLQAVANNVIDAATNNSTALRLKPETAAKVRVIWQSPRLPEDPIVWRKDLDPAVKEKLRSFFLSYGTAEGAEGDRQRAILAKLSFGRFMPADDSHLLPVREMSATRDLIAARNKNDAAGIKAAQDKLDAIHREQERVGAQMTSTTPSAAPAAPAKS